MIRIALQASAFLLSSLLLVGCATQSSVTKSEIGKSSGRQEMSRLIQGTWIPVTGELAGQPFPQQVLSTIRLILTDDQYTAEVAGKKDVGNLVLRLDEQPRGMDILGTEGPNKGKTILAIYELSGDSLKICYDLAGKNRPSEFRTKTGTQQFLVLYKRSTERM